MPTGNKHELRTYIPEATHRFLKEHAGSGGIGEFIGVVCTAYQKQSAMTDRLERLERYVLAILDKQK